MNNESERMRKGTGRYYSVVWLKRLKKITKIPIRQKI
jgi:hypothetical protein